MAIEVLSGQFGLMGSGVPVRRHRPEFGSNSGQRLGIVFAQVLDKLLADLTTQIPAGAGVVRINQGAQLDSIGGGIGDLQHAYLAPPQARGAHDAAKLLPK
ncbi:MAG: hypothetical protein WCE52_19545, partial [Candidatus Acidiferrum sp.]